MTDPGEGDPEAKFHEVVGLLEDWSPDPEDRGVEVSRGLRRMLDARLNAEESSRWDRDIVERQRGTLAADVTINGEIAVAVLGSARTAAVSSIRSRLSLLGGRYNYLVVYWRDAVDDDGDARRLIERRTTARSIGVEGIVFVGEEVPGDADPSDGPFSLPGLTTGAVAVGAAVGFGLFLSADGVVRGLDAIGGFPPLARAFVLGSGLLFCSVLGLALLLTR
ncbi:hypothetical protein ACFQE8_13300 [Salinirubellus sp. GCM10025818]|uniref:hypothetical protein n=1 Tax=Salinirubellus TaxID=2162630 RepID=UPI0030CDBCDD